jgi:5-methylcytosine-specific restriction endonuclease McrA
MSADSLISDYWKAAPSEHGPGKVHALREGGRTFCGWNLADLGGARVDLNTAERLEKSDTCGSCRRAIRSRIKRAKQDAEGQARQDDWQRRRAAKNQEWRERYDAHLSSDEWASLRQRVLERSDGWCEGCGTATAVQVHHLTYTNLGDELLWQLRAVCLPCHEKADEGRRGDVLG